MSLKTSQGLPSLLFACRRGRVGRPHVRGRRAWWLELSEHRGAMGPSGSPVEFCCHHVHSQEHSRCGCTKWKVRRYLKFYFGHNKYIYYCMEDYFEQANETFPITSVHKSPNCPLMSFLSHVQGPHISNLEWVSFIKIANIKLYSNSLVV